jgi:hypothetical protein
MAEARTFEAGWHWCRLFQDPDMCGIETFEEYANVIRVRLLSKKEKYIYICLFGFRFEGGN